MENLHVVFTMNPAEGGMAERAATSPALFNRCVLDWFGDWSKNALFQVRAGQGCAMESFVFFLGTPCDMP